MRRTVNRHPPFSPVLSIPRSYQESKENSEEIKKEAHDEVNERVLMDRAHSNLTHIYHNLQPSPCLSIHHASWETGMRWPEIT